MTSRTVQQFISWYRQSPLAEAVPPATPDEILAAEAAVGPFPADYRELLLAINGPSFDQWECFRVGVHAPKFLDLVQLTLDARSFAPHPLHPSFIAIQNNGGGDLFCFDTELVRETGGSPILYWDHANRSSPRDHIYKSTLADYLWEMVDVCESYRDEVR